VPAFRKLDAVAVLTARLLPAPLVGPAAAAKLVKALRKERTLQHYAAKDILRAAGLPLLGPDDSEVSADLAICP
jgi:hypothetical protein